MEFDIRMPIVRLDRTKIAILKEKISDPNITTRKLSQVLKEKYGITMSHARIAEIIKEMRESEVFRETVIPNENYFIFSFMEFSFNNTNFRENWRKTYEYLINCPNVILFFITDGIFRWKFIMVFRTFQEVSKWVHNFLKEYGDLVNDMNLLIVYRILKFKFDDKLLDDLLDETKADRTM
jgi:DNA-binding Lrp family transcriptional regulator